VAHVESEWDPREHFQLQDIALWECKLERFLDYQPGIHHEDHIRVQTRRTVGADMLEAVDAKGERAEYLRALVTLATRAVLAPIEAEAPSQSSSDHPVLFEVEATFAVVYQVTHQPTEEQLDAFVSFNCVHNAWPFWRQHVYDTLKRASLPVLTVPLFMGNKPTGSKNKEKKQDRVRTSAAEKS
jgi:hypothetical protein